MCGSKTLTLNAATILPAISGDAYAEAHIACHFGAMYVPQILEQVFEHEAAAAAFA